MEFIGNFFDVVGFENLFLVLIFLISFALVNFSLSRIFRKNPAVGSVTALLVALGVTAGVYYAGFDMEGIILDMGLDMGLVLPIFSLLILLGIFYLLWKIKLGKTLMILGIFLIGLSFFSYEKGIILGIGIVFLILGLLLWWRSKKKHDLNSDYSGRGLFGKSAGAIGKGAKWAYNSEKNAMKDRAERYKKWQQQRQYNKDYERAMRENKEREEKRIKEEYKRREEIAREQAEEQEKKRKRDEDRMLMIQNQKIEEERKKQEELKKKIEKSLKEREGEKQRQLIEKYKKQLKEGYNQRLKVLETIKRELESYQNQKRHLEKEQKNFPSSPLRGEIEKINRAILISKQQIRTLEGELEEITRRLSQY